MPGPETCRGLRSWHIAQISVARFRVARGHPVNGDFEAALDEMNVLAEASAGFDWRMIGEGESNDAGLTINMTAWESIEQLSAFAYRNLTHRTVMRRRKEWFIEMPSYLALWWISAGTLATLKEGRAKLDMITRLGLTQEAFDFKNPFPAPSRQGRAHARKLRRTHVFYLLLTMRPCSPAHGHVALSLCRTQLFDRIAQRDARHVGGMLLQEAVKARAVDAGAA